MKNNRSLPTATAHSGCEGTAENSVESIAKAAEIGADIIEIDIRFTADGKPVLSHDVPAGGETTLEEAFIEISKHNKLLVNLDIKETTHLEAITPLAEKYSLTDRIFYTGIFESDVTAVKQKTPDVKYYLNRKLRPEIFQTKNYISSLCSKIKDLGAAGLNANYKRVTKKISDALHKNNLELSLWTVNNADDMKKVLLLEPDNITSRYPSELIRILSKKES